MPSVLVKGKVQKCNHHATSKSREARGQKGRRAGLEPPLGIRKHLRCWRAQSEALEGEWLSQSERGSPLSARTDERGGGEVEGRERVQEQAVLRQILQEPAGRCSNTPKGHVCGFCLSFPYLVPCFLFLVPLGPL